MEAKKEDRQSRFFEWLARSVSSAQLSELYQAFADLEAALSSNIYLHHLTQPLVETADADAIDQLYGDLSTNKQFMRSYRSGVKLSLLRHYARYCRECQPAATGEQRQEVVSSGDALIDRLKRDGITYADNRPKNGALWIAQSPKTDALIKEAKAQGVQFVFSEAKQQWWTRDVSPKSIKEPEAIRPEIVKHNQSAFVEWLRDQDYDAVDIFAIHGTARKIHAMLLEEGVALGLFGTCEIDHLRAFIQVAKRREAFTKGDKKENRLWTKTVNCYLQFAESEKFAVKPTEVEQASSPEPASVPPAVKEAADLIQPDDENLTVGLVQEDGFRQWLKQSESDEQADQIVDVIRSAEQFARRNHMKGIKMFGVATSIMRSSVRRMSASNAFIKNDLRLYQLFKRAAALLVKYGTSLDSYGDVKPASVSTAFTAPMSTRADANPKKSSALEPPLLALLEGEQLSILRDALIQKGIRTLEDFKQLNLWVFMNQNGLYSIGERQAVCSLVRRAMASEAAAESGAHWKIVTLKSEYTGSSPAGVLVEYCRAMAEKYPLRFRSLIGQRMPRSAVVPLSRTRLDAGDFRMDNPEAYISCETDESSALAFARWVGEMCRDSDVPQRVISIAPAETVPHAKGEEKEGNLPEEIKSVDAEPVRVLDELPVPPRPAARPSVISPLQRKVEQLVQDADLAGMTLEQLYSQIPGTTMVALKQVRDNSTNLVDIEDRLIHKDAFVDWDEAAQKLEGIVEKLLSRNNGYVSAAQLYEYVRADMQMFLNDNDMDDQRKVFDLAQHLFEKEGYHDKRYTFWMKTHISRSKETLTSNLDVIKKFARDHNGFFQFEDLVTYLERVGIRTGNLRGQMQIGSKPIFFCYSGEEIISAESMRIDKDWLTQAGKAFERLFADVGDHIVLRSINSIWYEQLPTLPGNIPWTPLLLQYILQFYGEKLGAKTIGAELNQKYYTLQAMLVTPDSEIQTFADAVVAYLIDSGIPERQFEAEGLRRRLVDGGLIAGNELIWNMPRAIGSDPRFAWDASGEKVNIRV